jgi:hypothetical protein
MFGRVLAAAIASLLLAGAAAADDLNPFYKGQMSPGTNVPCCNKKDCMALDKWRQDAKGEYEIWIKPGFWYKPAQRIIRKEATPDGRAHACIQYGEAAAYTSVKITVFCVWIPIPSM